jgi:hypothetical protein
LLLLENTVHIDLYIENLNIPPLWVPPPPHRMPHILLENLSFFSPVSIFFSHSRFVYIHARLQTISLSPHDDDEVVVVAMMVMVMMMMTEWQSSAWQGGGGSPEMKVHSYKRIYTTHTREMEISVITVIGFTYCGK